MREATGNLNKGGDYYEVRSNIYLSINIFEQGLCRASRPSRWRGPASPPPPEIRGPYIVLLRISVLILRLFCISTDYIFICANS